MDKIVAWLAPICATLLTCAGQLWLNGKYKESEAKMDRDRAETQAKRDAEAEWRVAVDKHFAEQDDKIQAILKAQVTQMRSDTLHRIHRYLDDLGCASTEEKNAFWAEYEEYCELCEKYGIDNDFVETLAHRVMDLPERPL